MPYFLVSNFSSNFLVLEFGKKNVSRLESTGCARRLFVFTRRVILLGRHRSEMQVVIDLCLEGMPCVSALRRFSLEARRQRQIVVVLLMIDFMLIISPFQKLHWDFQERPRENVTKEPQIIIEKEPHIFWFASSCIVGSLYEGSLSLWTEYLVELGTIENVRSGSTRPRVLVGLRICAPRPQTVRIRGAVGAC